MLKPVVLIWIMMAGIAGRAMAQPSVQQIEQGILGHLKHIQYWRFEYAPEDTTFAQPVNAEDSVRQGNEMLKDYLLKEASRQPAMLKADFGNTENTDLKIVTADDKRLRLYSWDTHIGEGHRYNTVCQYETQRGVKATADTQVIEGKNYQKVYNVNAQGGKKYYLAVSADINKDGQTVKLLKALTITGDKLEVANVFDEDGKQVSVISYTYDYAANYNFKKMKEEYDLRLEKQKLYVPGVDNYKTTGKWKVYNFDGEKFVRDKNAE